MREKPVHYQPIYEHRANAVKLMTIKQTIGVDTDINTSDISNMRNIGKESGLANKERQIGKRVLLTRKDKLKESD